MKVCKNSIKSIIKVFSNKKIIGFIASIILIFLFGYSLYISPIQYISKETNVSGFLEWAFVIIFLTAIYIISIAVISTLFQFAAKLFEYDKHIGFSYIDEHDIKITIVAKYKDWYICDSTHNITPFMESKEYIHALYKSRKESMYV